MEAMTTEGIQIIETKRTKKTNQLRLLIELTENDSKKFAGAIAIAEINQLIGNMRIDWTEAQNEHQVISNPTL